ncbi:FYVE, RhoGEF and PH domain-containing protein 6 [Geodia barretti]|uniref:FYVE, RhoGEF and PH domain-containing protein 6 n=1 Tax=Geodia barretti TaxID=519541 RepID=A0AA35X207_GEOBA|nr:FYVE, RhoGEF and PH domain-containing protein 6 [Geodia barretti]
MADDGEPLEITALRTNLTAITDTVTVGDNLQWFSNCLVEKAFIAQRAAQAILGGGATPANKASQLIDGVFTVIRRSDRKSYWFAEFVSIFSTDRAYAELVEKLKRHVRQTNLQQLLSPIPASPSPSSSLHVPASSGTTPATASSKESPAPSSTTTPFSPPAPPLPSPHHSSFWSLEKVEASLKNLEEMFGNLHADADTELGEKERRDEMFFKRFRSRLLLLPVRKATLHVKFFTAYEDEILAAQNSTKILAILCRFVDYRNFEILYYVVLTFCGTSLKQSMKDYCKMLKEFETATTVDVYLSAIPDEADEELLNGFSQMVVKIDKPESQCTLLEVRKLNKAIIEKSSLCSHSVYIGAVSRNCVVVRLRFPSSAVGWVLEAITPDFMTTHRLTEVSVDGHPLSLIPAQRNNLENLKAVEVAQNKELDCSVKTLGDIPLGPISNSYNSNIHGTTSQVSSGYASSCYASSGYASSGYASSGYASSGYASSVGILPHRRSESLQLLNTGDREMMDLQRKLTNYRGTLTGKKLLKEGVIRKCNRRGAKKEVYLFLLTDVLLYTKYNEFTRKYSVAWELSIRGMEVVDMEEGGQPVVRNEPLSFTVTSKERAIHLVASSPEEKDEWIQALQRAISDLLLVHHHLTSSKLLPGAGLGSRAPVWVPDTHVTACQLPLCNKKFSLIERKHHCRQCGRVVCSGCSVERRYLIYLQKEGRVCNACIKGTYGLTYFPEKL